MARRRYRSKGGDTGAALLGLFVFLILGKCLPDNDSTPPAPKIETRQVTATPKPVKPKEDWWKDSPLVPRDLGGRLREFALRANAQCPKKGWKDYWSDCDAALAVGLGLNPSHVLTTYPTQKGSSNGCHLMDDPSTREDCAYVAAWREVLKSLHPLERCAFRQVDLNSEICTKE